ncbi:MAG: hypothetical protein ACTHOK_00470, partial [Nocardioidaceae bacterium]
MSTVRDGGSPGPQSAFARGEGTRTTTATPAADHQPAAKSDASMVSLKVPTTDNATNAPRTQGGDLHPSAAPQHGPVVVDQLTAPSVAHFGMVGVTWKSGFPEGDLRVQIQTLTDGSWTDWSDLEIDHDTGPLPNDPAGESDVRAGTVPTWVDHADGVHVRLWSDDGKSPEDVQVALIDGGTGLAQPTTPVAQPAAATAPAGVQNASLASTGSSTSTVTATADGTTTTDPATTMDPGTTTTDPGTVTDPGTTTTDPGTTTVAATGL